MAIHIRSTATAPHATVTREPWVPLSIRWDVDPAEVKVGMSAEGELVTIVVPLSD